MGAGQSTLGVMGAGQSVADQFPDLIKQQQSLNRPLGQSRVRQQAGSLWTGQQTAGLQGGLPSGGRQAGLQGGLQNRAGLQGAAASPALYDYDYPDYSSGPGRRFGGGLGDYGGGGMYGYGGYGGGAGRGYGGSGAGYGASGGGYSPVSVVSGYGPGVCQDQGLNPFLVLATVAGAGLAFFLIYRQITTGGKRNLRPGANDFVEHISNLIWSGE